MYHGNILPHGLSSPGARFLDDLTEIAAWLAQLKKE
jgi:hypothetical protein